MIRKPHAKFLLENLEPRLLLSADLALLPVDGGALSAATGPALEIALAPGHGTLAEQAINAATREIVFVDAGVEDYQSLVDDLAAQTSAERLFDVVILDAGRDGITQISTYLAQQQNVAAVHIVSHGASGEVTLGSTSLNLTTLDRYADQLEGWQQSLTADADLLFYGCNLAAGPEGQALIDSLALLTGADVAASTDLTGSALSGGDWSLEFNRGVIDTPVAFSGKVQQEWTGTLAVVSQAGSSTSAATAAASTTLSFSHTVASVSEPLLLVSVAVSGDTPVSTVTWGGIPLSFVAAQASNSGEVRVEFWQLSAPAPGTADVVVTLSAAQKMAAGASTFQDVDVIDPIGAVVGGKGNSSPTDISISSAPGHLVVDVAAAIRAESTGIGADQTELWTNQSGTGMGPDDVWALSSREAGAATVQMTQSFRDKGGGAEKWTALAVSINPVNTVAPVIISNGGGATASVSVPENTTAVTTVVATDADGTTPSYKIIGGADAALFTINTTSGALAFISAPDYEALGGDPTFEVIVSAYDSKFSDSQTITVTVTDANDPPVVAVPIPDQTATQNISFSFVLPVGTFTDQDAGDLLTYAAALSGGAPLPAWLSFNPATRTFSGTPGSGDVGANTVRVTATDLSSASAFDEFVLTVINVNDASVLAGIEAAPVEFTENAAAMPVTATLTISDVDDVNIEGATVQITDNYASGEDLLGFANTAAITGSWDAVSGTLTLAGTDTLANYQQALRSVTYANSSETPSALPRTVSFTVNDGDVNSNTLSRVINVTPVNDVPVAVANTVTTSEDTPYPFAATDFTFSDVESDALVSATLTNLVLAGGSLTHSGGTIVNPGDTLSTAQLDTLVYTPAANAFGNALASFDFTVNDAESGTVAATMTIDVASVDDAPDAIDDTYNTDEDTALTITGPGVLGNDSIGGDGGTLQVVGNTDPANGTLTLNANGSFTYTPNPNWNVTDSFTYTIEDADGDQATATVTIDVTPVNDLPVGGFSVANVIPASEITQSRNGDGLVTINWKATDIELQDVTLSDFMYSDDGGANWYALASSAPLGGGWTGTWATAADFGSASTYSFTFNTQHADVAAPALVGRDVSTVRIKFKVYDGTDYSADVISENFRVDNEAPTPLISSAHWHGGGERLHIQGSNFYSIAPKNTDLKTHNLDWSKLVIKVYDNGVHVSNITFTGTDVLEAMIGSDGDINIRFTDAKENAIEATPGFSGGDDVLAITTGFFKDYFGNAATTDGDVPGPPTVTNLNADETYTEDTPLDFVNDIVVTDNGGVVDIILTLSDSAAGTLSTGAAGTATWSFDPVTGRWEASGYVADVNQLLRDLVFTPTPDYNGNFSIATRVSNGFSSISGSIDVTGTPVVDIQDDSDTVAEDGSVITSVLANDTFEAPGRTITTVTQGVNGSVAIVDASAGTVRYTPNSDFHGSDSYTYTVTSGDVTETATVTVTVTQVDDPAAFGGDTGGSGAEDGGAITGTLTVSDAADGMTTPNFTVGTAATNGNASINAATGAWSYTPILDYHGADSFVVSVTDDDGNVATQLISLTITAVADIVNDTATLDEDGNVTTSVLANDTFENSGRTITAVTQGANGSVAIVDASAGTVRYTPNTDFHGSDSYTYTVTSGDVTETATVTVTVTQGDDPAAFGGDTGGSGAEDGGAITGTLTASDAADGMSAPDFTVGTAASNGSASIDAATGAWSYTPNADFNGSDSFTVSVTDDDGNVETQVISLTVTPVNDAPIAVDDTLSATEDTPVTFTAAQLTGNDIDVDSAVLTIASVSSGTGGTAVLNADGTVTFTPSSDFNGPATFTYSVTDGLLTSNTATVTVNVAAVNDPPVAVDDTLAAIEDIELVFDPLTALLGNDTDIDGGMLSLLSFGQPANGSLSLDPSTGKLTYKSAGNYFGNDSFTYTVSDGMGGTADGVALIVIAPIADTPQVGNISTIAGVLSEAIVINRHASDGPEVTHFRISGITGGTLYHADGVTPISNDSFITVAQGQAGVKFMPASGSSNGSFQVEASLGDNISMVGGGKATATITVLPRIEPPVTPEPEPEVVPEDKETAEEPAPDPVTPPTETDDANDQTVQEIAPVNAPVLRLNATPPEIVRLGVEGLTGTVEGSSSSSSQSLRILLDANVLRRLQDTLNTLDISTLSREGYDLMRSSLDSFKEELGKESLIERAVFSSAVASSIGLSAGYVIWMLKGGSLLASVLSSVPAWQLTDPLSILAGRRGDDDDDETLETIIEDGSQADEDTVGETEDEKA